ncbi:SMI1/KNR4 family protein [Streptomyces cinnamoneus]|uniref:SMI1/KNR4 family protein n=1 Tax=Streptomyces cinnamoneus TaxID=53446 RepID=UPI0033CD398D
MIAQLIEKRAQEAMEDPGIYSPIKLCPSATQEQLTELESVVGQVLEPRYREFLSVSDGLENFYFEMPILGCRDWPESSALVRAQSFLELILDMGTLEDEGLPSSTALAPVSVDEDGTSGIFMIDTGSAMRERFWWVGDGSSLLFPDFADVIAYVIDPASYLSR